jgi:hypothetical protein
MKQVMRRITVWQMPGPMADEIEGGNFAIRKQDTGVGRVLCFPRGAWTMLAYSVLVWIDWKPWPL